MAYEQRAPLDYRFGQLTAGVTSLDTTLTSVAFASLPSDLTTAKYLPITLADDSLGVYEVVWVTGHTAGSSAVTVLRGREGSPARAWSQGAVWRVAPLVRDILPAYTRATLPADAHTGMRAVLTDEGIVVEKTALGWAQAIGGGAYRHVWSVASVAVGPNASVVPTGLVKQAGGASIASVSNGVLTLGRRGLWEVSLQASFDYGTALARYVASLSWPNGAMPVDPLEANAYGLTGFPGCGAGTPWRSWRGWVSDTEAARPITPRVSQNNANGATLNATSVILVAEYLGG